MTTNLPSPKRCEIWVAKLDPTVGTEIQKMRPVVVINSDAIGSLSLRLIAPITEWKEHFGRSFWLVRIEPDHLNGLDKESTVDTLQLRGLDVRRFSRKIGQISPIKMEEIVAAIAGVIEYQ